MSSLLVSSSTASAMIAARNLEKSFGAAPARRAVLREVSFEVQRGEFVALVGRSGSGKSTLLHILAGLDQADSGSAIVDGSDLSRLGPEPLADFRLRRVGLVFQFFNFLPTLSLRENVALPAYLLGVPTQSARDRAASLLDSVGLSESALRLPNAVSGGELQRAAIARALINEPAVLFADEPTGNLDEENSEHVLSLLQRLVAEREVTVLMVTHDAAVKARAHRSLTIADGKLCA